MMLRPPKSKLFPCTQLVRSANAVNHRQCTYAVNHRQCTYAVNHRQCTYAVNHSTYLGFPGDFWLAELSFYNIKRVRLYGEVSLISWLTDSKLES